MSPENQLLIQRTVEFVQKTMKGDGGSHDWTHIDRVRKLALRIASQEGADLLTVELAALLHDIADHKFTDGNTESGPEIAAQWLSAQQQSGEFIRAVTNIIREVSYKGAAVDTKPSSTEGCIVQDADRLDAMGAIGIARAFSYGGYRERPLYDPGEDPEQHADFESYSKSTVSTIGHFYEKLLLLKELMNTKTGRAMAESRHAYMTGFIEQFMREWEAEI